MIRARMFAFVGALLLALVTGVACASAAPPPAPTPAAAQLVCGRPSGKPTVAGRLVLRTNQCLVLEEPDGSLRQLFLATASNIYPALPVWSPDGTRVAFTQQLFFNGKAGADWGDDLYVMPAAGGAPELVRAHRPTGEQVQGVAWAPDGKALVFGDFEPIMKDGNISSYSGHLKRIDLATKQETTIVEGAFTPSFSRDGKRLAFMMDQGLFVADPDGKNSKLLVPTGQFQTLYFPRISPDGSSVAFSASAPAPGTRDLAPRPEGLLDRLAALFLFPTAAEAHGVPMDIWKVDASTKALTQLTKFFEDDPQPAWSADGKLLIVHATGALYEVAADGSSISGAKVLGPGTFGGQVDVR